MSRNHLIIAVIVVLNKQVWLCYLLAKEANKEAKAEGVIVYIMNFPLYS